jgi:lipoprotein signal peptidase
MQLFLRGLPLFLILIDRLLKAASVTFASYDTSLLFAPFTFYLNSHTIISRIGYFSIPLVVGIGLVAMQSRYKKEEFYSSFLYIFLGAASNMYDVFRYGGVVDMIELPGFSVFNLADLMIIGGCLSALRVIIRSHSHV